jgi:Mlc titration factor MtfA (ptsG expression regulator)
MWKGQRRQRLRATPLTVEGRQLVETHCPFYFWLPPADRHELEGIIQVLLAEKNFEGCGGLVLTDKIKLAVASQAGLLLLRRRTDYYDRLKSILVYPTSYTVSRENHLGSGVMEERAEVRAGESWGLGVVILSWDMIVANIQFPDSGHNLILHEFAHQLDYEDGHMDGRPLIGRGESTAVQRQRTADWQRIMRSEFQNLQNLAASGQPSFLNPYGASSAAEFFAVTTEAFFCRSRELQQWHPPIYEQMKWYYQQDPVEWNRPPVNLQQPAA